MFEHLLGHTLDRYQVLSIIGEDDLGTVLRAHDPSVQRDVAIKVLSPGVTSHPGFSDRFVQVARTAARLDHPNLIHVYDFRESQNLHYLVMEYIPGDNLEQMLASLRRGGRWLLLPEAVHLVRQLALAMEYIRSQGAQQRALRTSKVMIKPTPSDRLPYLPVLTDLGLAQLVEEGVGDSQVIALSYISPEGAVGRATGPRSDVYSLGVLLFELSTGQLPFPVESREDAVRYHNRQPLPPPRSIRPDLPVELEEVLVRALEKNPEARYASPTALADALERISPAVAAVKSAPPAYENAASLLVPYQESLLEEPRPAPPAAPPRHDPEGPTEVFVPSVDGPGVEGILENAQLSVEAGATAATTLILTNRSAAAAHYRITVDGLPPAWVTVAPQVLRLEPGEDVQVRLTIRPPRAPQTRAGRYPMIVRAVQQEPPGRVTEVRGALTIGVFFQFRSELTTTRLNINDTLRLAITNLGNAQETFTINLQDPEGGLMFTPPQSQLRLEEGQTGLAEFNASLNPPRLVGSERIHPFRAQVVSAHGEAQSHSGGIVSRPFIPIWALGVLLVVLLCMIGVLGMYLSRENIAISQQTRTFQAIGTGTAQAALNFAEGQTATALALVSANQATIDAVTATAAWQAADDDGDGLGNQQEIDLGTIPNDPDTDNDALPDGQEVQLGTDPLRPDTDGDRLTDGEEISRGLNPLEIDTDGDGEPDASDPSPAEASTPTPNLGATQAVFQTQTAAAQLGTQAAQNTAQAGTAAVQATVAAAQTATAAAIGGTAAAETAQAAALTQTAQAGSQVTETPAPPQLSGRVVYIYLTDRGLADEYLGLMQQHGLQVDLLPLDAIASTDFTPFQAILIGPETGDQANWGDPNGDQARRLNDSGLPVLGLGPGGYAYFGTQGLLVGFDNGVIARGASIAAVDPGSALWAAPYPIALPEDQVLDLYEGNNTMAAIVVEQPGGDLNPIGRRIDESTHYPVIAQAGRYLLWGFSEGPDSMTNLGRQAFINLLDALLP